MTTGDLEYAFRQAMNTFDKWNDVVGMFDKRRGYYYEIRSIIEDAVRIGAMSASGITNFYDKNGKVKKD